jgi:membrane protein DedA with SNARE-associated domain
MKPLNINLGNRTTIEIVVLVFTGVVSTALLILIIGAVLMRLIHPDAEMKPAAELAANILSMIVGALVAFIGGRAVGRWEAQNDKSKQQEP